ncbi:MAG: serine/threonine protein kinase [Planctomycetes bacterium]|nr:serine/threonine protein kinase [Planctomycetota bacterium]NUQ33545.1 serine/threonine protein kinase [Planctomycetaceae bacterium]
MANKETASARSTTVPALPLRMANYELLELIARGGMGTVYRAHHVFLDKPVAVKILRGDAPQREQVIEAFRREAQALARLNHPSIVQVVDVGEADGQTYIAMDYAPGMDLARWVKRDGRLAPNNLLFVSRQVVEGIASAHAAGVLHRDIKPDNIICDHLGSVKVTDFGLAGDVRLVAAGRDKPKFATPAYAAPEVLSGGESDACSDVFSLGATLYYLASGHLPFGRDAVLAAQMAGTKPLWELAPDLPRSFTTAVMTCIEIDRAKRPQNAGEMLALMFPDTRIGRRWLIVGIALGLLIAGLAAALVALLLTD